MYEYRKSQIDELRRRFEGEVGTRSPRLEAVGREYLDALTSFVDEYNTGPGADPRLLGLDTTGQLDRAEEDVAWAEDERRRVRKIISRSP